MSRSQRVPEDALYAATALIVLIALGVAQVWGPVAAGRMLAVVLACHASARILLPDGAVPRVLSRPLDAIGGLSVGCALWYFSSWGATPLVP